MDISKLKVVDLKKELKTRGLSTLGSKNELVERLQEALNVDDVDNGAEDDLLDEDAVLADETDEAILDEGNGTAPEDDAALLTPTSLSAPKPTTDQDVNKPNQGSPPKKIILNRKVTTSTVDEGSLPLKEENADEKNGSSENDISKDEKKIVKLGSLTAEERAKLRAEKFSVPVPDSLKKAARAERFGITSNPPTASVTNNAQDNEKLLKRQARFGVVTTGGELDAKKQKRAERFGAATNTSSAANDELKKKRAERFGLQ